MLPTIATRLSPGDRAPNIALRSADGASGSLDDARTTGPVLLAFVRHFG